MCPIEEFYELAVSDRAGLVCQLYSLCVACTSRADFSVCYHCQLFHSPVPKAMSERSKHTWVLGVSAGISGDSFEVGQMSIMLGEEMFCSPLLCQLLTLPSSNELRAQGGHPQLLSRLTKHPEAKVACSTIQSVLSPVL